MDFCTQAKCSNCGALHIRNLVIFSRNTSYFACSSVCAEVLKQKLPEWERKADLEEKKYKELQERVLPEVRVLIGHKDSRGRIITLHG